MNNEKNKVRKQILARRAELTQFQIDDAEKQALNKLTQLESFQKSDVVMLYHDFRKEVPTGKLISAVLESGKKLILPLTNPDFEIIPFEIPKEIPLSAALKISPMGIAEPNPELCPVAEPDSIDLVIVPGSVFDVSGNRIGYGKGCYDRFLPLIGKKALKLGLAYDFQVLDKIPTESQDIRMDGMITILV